jgi:hypothetical protein
MGRPSRMLESLRTAVEQGVLHEFASDIFEPTEPLSRLLLRKSWNNSGRNYGTA